MKNVPKAVYRSVAEIEEFIRERESDSMRLRPDTDEHRAIMQEIARLRVYADMKLWLSGPVKQRA